MQTRTRQRISCFTGELMPSQWRWIPTSVCRSTPLPTSHIWSAARTSVAPVSRSRMILVAWYSLSLPCRCHPLGGTVVRRAYYRILGLSAQASTLATAGELRVSFFRDLWHSRLPNCLQAAIFQSAWFALYSALRCYLTCPDSRKTDR